MSAEHRFDRNRLKSRGRPCQHRARHDSACDYARQRGSGPLAENQLRSGVAWMQLALYHFFLCRSTLVFTFVTLNVPADGELRTEEDRVSLGRGGFQSAYQLIEVRFSK